MEQVKEQSLPRIRFICDGGFHNVALIPTIYVGSGSAGLWTGWIYILWWRSRVGFARY